MTTPPTELSSVLYPEITRAVEAMGPGALTEPGLTAHVHPLFSRVLARNGRTREIYLANHSLGRPMDLVAEEVQAALDAWYAQLDEAWDYWLHTRQRYRDRIARLLRWPSADAIVPKTSAGQGLRAVINAMPAGALNIVSTRAEFDSIDFILKAYAHKGRASVRWVQPDERDMLRTQDVLDAIDDSTDLIVLSHVCFVTGQIVQGLDKVIAKARRVGALVVLDSYHAAGVLDTDYESLDPDFVIGGNYKYTRGGPGACFLAINPRHLSPRGGTPEAGGLFPTDTGWFAKQDPFAYKRRDLPEYAAGGDAWLEATPPVLTYFQALPGLELTLALGVDRLRTYSLGQQAFLCEQLREQGVTPRVLDHHGAYVLIETHDGPALGKRLKSEGVNVDARPYPRSGGWVVRLCPDLLNTRDELTEAASRVAGAMASVHA